MSRKAFTLAEILITLTVIGVVAALTIPTLLQNTNQAEIAAAWKKDFSDINQATIQIISDNGGTMKGICSDWDHDCFRNAYSKYLSFIKTCNAGPNNGNCWHKPGEFYEFDSTPITSSSWSGAAGAILNNGSLIWIANDKTSDCHGGVECGYFSVDVNGFKKPNTLGKDIFRVIMAQDKTSLPGDGTACFDQGSCAAYYLVH